MQSARYAIFEPKNRIIKLNRNVIAYGLVVVGFIVHYLPITINETFRFYYILFTFFICLYFLITSFWFYQPLNGKINGELEFMPDVIIVNETQFKIYEQNVVYLHYEDYFGERKYYSKGNLNQALQQGVKNYIQFADASGCQHKYYFRIDNQEEAEKLIPFINRYNN